MRTLAVIGSALLTATVLGAFVGSMAYAQAAAVWSGPIAPEFSAVAMGAVAFVFILVTQLLDR
jgi:hypothetical protein